MHVKHTNPQISTVSWCVSDAQMQTLKKVDLPNLGQLITSVVRWSRTYTYVDEIGDDDW